MANLKDLISHFQPACQKILEKIPEKTCRDVIDSLSLMIMPEMCQPDFMINVLREVYDLDIEPEGQNPRSFPESPLKTELAEELESDSPELTVQAMAIIVGEIKERFENKGIDFNCFVFKEKNLKDFLINLENSKDELKDNTRFQVLSLNHNNKHWSLLDIRFVNGKLEFYLLDAAFYSNLGLITKINNICNNFEIKYSSGNIQSDFVHCAIFTLDHAIQVAKMPDFHDELKKVKSYSFTNENRDIQFVPLENFSAKFGMLLRNMQSLKKLTRLADEIKGLVGNATLDIGEYLDDKNRKVKVTSQSGVAEHNVSIDIKTKRLKEKALSFLLQLASDDECQDVIDAHCVKTLPAKFKNQENREPLKLSKEEKIVEEMIFPIYTAFEVIEKTSFALNFKCKDLFEALNKNGKFDFDLLLAISKNIEEFKEMYQNNIISIGLIRKIDADQFNTLVDKYENEKPNMRSSSELRRSSGAIFSEEQSLNNPSNDREFKEDKSEKSFK